MVNDVEIKELQSMMGGADPLPAFTRLYHIYFTPLLRFAVSLMNASFVAEEIVSDVLLRLWQMRAEVQGIHNLTVFLYTCIRNQCLNHLGKKSQMATFSLDDDVCEMAGSQPDPEQLCISAETVKTLVRAVNTLPPKCQMIFRLVREDHFKYREVAELLNISQKTVEAQIGIAVRKLSDALRREDQATRSPFLKIVS